MLPIMSHIFVSSPNIRDNSMKHLTRFFIVILSIVSTVVILLIAAFFLLNSSAVQTKVLQRATVLLSRHLGTQVSIEDVDISLFGQYVHLHGLKVEEHDKLPGVMIEELIVDLDMVDLLKNKKVNVERAKIRALETSWESVTKKGPMSNRAFINELIAYYGNGRQEVNIAGLNFQTDNHRPRKNTGKPKHGFFDVGHLDITADLQLHLDTIGRDTLKGELIQFTATDSVTGIDIRNITALVSSNFKEMYFKEMTFQQKNTVLHIPEAQFTIPSKKQGRIFSFSTGTVTGRTLLKDISRTFAPVLANFHYPLNLSVKVSGNDSTMAFRDIHVSSDDQRFRISAMGDLKGLKVKEDLNILFKIHQLTAHQGETEKIINQFVVKKFMMKQLGNLGDIGFTGNVNILYKNERFRGQISTAAGLIDAFMSIDGKQKYVTGEVKTSSFNLGLAMGMEKLTDLMCHADFKVDISKPRTAAIRKEKGGKLPICSVNAAVDDCNFHNIHFRNLTANLQSDGAVALGTIIQNGKHRDISCAFSFTDTDDMQKMHIDDVGIQFHKLSDAERQAKLDNREQHATEMGEKLDQQAVERERKIAEELEKKQKAELERQALKEQKAAEKAAKKEAKKEQKAAAKSKSQNN